VDGLRRVQASDTRPEPPKAHPISMVACIAQRPSTPLTQDAAVSDMSRDPSWRISPNRPIIGGKRHFFVETSDGVVGRLRVPAVHCAALPNFIRRSDASR
jgi:hypothetical protein